MTSRFRGFRLWARGDARRARRSSPARTLGVVVFVAMLASPAPDGLSAPAWNTAAVAGLMAVWWSTEAIPVAMTALLPLILFPLLHIGDIKTVAAPYAHPLVILFVGGFMIALAMERCNLHRRIALNVITRVGTRADQLIAGFMVAAAFLSMWVTNTATTMMMTPVALAVAGVVAPPSETNDRLRTGEPDKAANFPIALLLAIAYAASIGGLGTLVGTVPNALLAGFMAENHDRAIGFANWMAAGVPLIIVLLPLIWFALTRVTCRYEVAARPDAARIVRAELDALGPMRPAEKRVLAIFALTAGLWITRPLLVELPVTALQNLSDTGIALFGALLLFLTPSGDHKTAGENAFLMDWSTASRLPWGLLLLFGGGLSLAKAMAGTGLAEWIGGSVAIVGAWHPALLLVAVIAVVIFLTEMTSNTATVAALLPVIASVAIGAGMDPLILALPATMAASCAFMLPVATPPNAIVFGTGKISIPQMAKAGFLLNLICVAVISVMAWFGLPLLRSAGIL